MAKLKWGQAGERRYENGVSRGVLYTPDNTGVYASGVAWNGLVTVTESPSGAESNKQYADNGVYVNLLSAEEFAATIEAFTFPEEFNQHNGLAVPAEGVYVAQQGRKPFGLCYRTEIGNDLDSRAGYKLHLVYGASAAPSESAYSTINDSPEAVTMSWEVSTVPTDAGDALLPTALVVVDSTKVAADALADLEALLYGTDGAPGAPATLPTPEEVIALFAVVTP
jgi:hypothetical protein